MILDAMKSSVLICFTVGINAATTRTSTPPISNFTSPPLTTPTVARSFSDFRALVVCSPLVAVVPNCAVHFIDSAMSVVGCTDRANALACQCIPASSVAIHEHAFSCVIDSCGIRSVPAVLSAGVSVCGCVYHGALPGPTSAARTSTSLAETTTTTPTTSSTRPPPPASCGIYPCQAKADAVPACATDCIASAALATASCGRQDYHCQCANTDDIHAAAFNCITTGCNGRDAANVLGIVASLCSCVEGNPTGSCADPGHNDPAAVKSPAPPSSPPPPPPPPSPSSPPPNSIPASHTPSTANVPISNLPIITPKSSSMTSNQIVLASTSLSIPQPAVSTVSAARSSVSLPHPGSSANSIPVTRSSAVSAPISSVYTELAHAAPTPAAGMPNSPVPEASAPKFPASEFSSPGSSEPESSALPESRPVTVPTSASVSSAPVPSTPASNMGPPATPASDIPLPISSSPSSPATDSSSPNSAISGSSAPGQAGPGIIPTLTFNLSTSPSSNLLSLDPPCPATPSSAPPSSAPEISTTISAPISTLISFTTYSSASKNPTSLNSIPSPYPCSSPSSSSIHGLSSSSLPEIPASGYQPEERQSVGSETSRESNPGESCKISSTSPSKTADPGKLGGSSISRGTRCRVGLIPGIVGAACIAVAASI